MFLQDCRVADLRLKEKTVLFFKIAWNIYAIKSVKTASIIAIKNMPAPKNTKELKSFLGAVNFYRKFIRNASSILKPLYSLLKKNVNFFWSQECKAKKLLLSTSLLSHFDPERPIKLIVDASQFALGATLSHLLQNNVEKPVAFASKLLNKAIVFGIKIPPIPTIKTIDVMTCL